MKGSKLRFFNNDKIVSRELRCGIYSITNLVDGKFYIGSSKNYRSRWSHHLNLLRNNKHHNIHLQNAWLKYGEDNFMFSLMVSFVSDNNLIEIEQKYLNLYFDLYRKKLYNVSKLVVGGGCGQIKGIKNPKSKLDDDKIRKIRKEFYSLSELKIERYKRLSIKYKVSPLTISRIIRNELWTHVI